MQDSSFQRQYWEKERTRRPPDHPTIEAVVAPKIARIQKHVTLTPATALLDVGCGNGYSMYHFSRRCKVCGLDYSSHLLATNPCEKLVRGGAEALPFRDESFDVVFCSNLLHHVVDPLAVLSEMARVSRRHVIVSEANRNNPVYLLYFLLKREERGGLKFSLRYLRRICQAADLRVIDACTITMFVSNRIPVFLLPVFRLFNFRSPISASHVVISEKKR